MISALALTLLTAAPAPSVVLLPEAELTVAIYQSADPKAEAAAVKTLNAFNAGGGKAKAEGMKVSELPEFNPTQLEFAGKDLSADDRKKFAGFKRAIAVHFNYPTRSVAALKAANTAIANAAQATGGMIFDISETTLYTPEKWKERRVTNWKDTYPMASTQFTVHYVAEKDGTVTLDTAGLSRFGLKDLMIEDAHRSSAESLGQTLNLIVQTVVEGGNDAGGKLAVDIQKIKNESARAIWMARGQKNAEQKIPEVLLRPTKVEGEDLVAIDFPMSFGPEPSQRYDRATTMLWGVNDSVTTVEHDEKVLAASARARKTLLGKYKPIAQKGIPIGQRLMVKAPFKFDKGNEWMWVDVMRWEGTTITGRLENEPELATQYKAGQTVKVAEADLFDFMYSYEDGSFYGNEVGQIMAPEMFEKTPEGRLRVKEEE